MSNRQIRGVILREPKNVQRVVQRITSNAFQKRKELEYAGRIARLIGSWMKSRELDKIGDMDKSLADLEETLLECRNESELYEYS